jgi:hypothetical protein
MLSAGIAHARVIHTKLPRTRHPIANSLMDAWEVRIGQVLRLVKTAQKKEHTAPP